MLNKDKVYLDKNIFFVSGIFHLYHVQNIIKNYGYENCCNHLIIIHLEHTQDNDENINNILKQVVSDLFENVATIKQRELNEYFFTNYKLKNVSKIFLTTFNGIFAQISLMSKLNGVQLNMYEEGLSSYKLAPINQKKNILKSKLEKNFLKKLYWFLKGLFVEYIMKFDCIYVSFPDKISKVIKYKNNCEDYSLKFVYNDLVVDELKNLKKILNGVEIMFLSQPMQYTELTEFEYIDLVINYLEKNYKGKIYFKIHPRECTQKIKYLNEKIKYSNNEYIISSEINCNIEIPSELILSNLNFKKVIAFSSTTLIYAASINRDLSSISIYNIIYNCKPKLHCSHIMKEIELELKKFKEITFV